MIELKDVAKRYGNKVAVDGLNLKIPKGKLFAFIGPNGAGKTTTVKMITGLLQPTSGEIYVDGKKMSTDSLDLKGIIAYIPDQPFLYEKLSGREFLNFIGQIYRIPKPELDAEIGRYLELFQMTEYIDQLIESYSLGMKQKVVITAGVLHKPRLIVVDEPLVGLDPANVRIVKDLFRQLVRSGTTIFMSTHILSIAQEIADLIGVIHQGKLIARGTFEELKARQKNNNGQVNLEDIFLMLCNNSCDL
ncbi:MAG: ABC transporter ATP-binding protein [Planctomycetota bacterium]